MSALSDILQKAAEQHLSNYIDDELECLNLREPMGRGAHFTVMSREKKAEFEAMLMEVTKAMINETEEVVTMPEPILTAFGIEHGQITLAFSEPKEPPLPPWQDVGPRITLDGIQVPLGVMTALAGKPRSQVLNALFTWPIRPGFQQVPQVNDYKELTSYKFDSLPETWHDRSPLL